MEDKMEWGRHGPWSFLEQADAVGKAVKGSKVAEGNDSNSIDQLDSKSEHANRGHRYGWPITRHEFYDEYNWQERDSILP